MTEEMLLPPLTVLLRTGYTQLAYWLNARPELFAHIPRERLDNHPEPETYVPFAERLASENGGLLPHDAELRRIAGNGLANAVGKYPHLFAHLPQFVKLKPIDHHVKVAEQLAKGNNGVLPFSSWLQKNGYCQLYKLTKSQPECFAHIPKHPKAQRKPVEWVPAAEELAKQNNGVLRSYRWLVKNGHGKIADAVKRRPELFSHIPQERREAA